MNEMVERVARAIEADSNYVISQHHSKALARAAIAAMREPTASMIDAAWEPGPRPVDFGDYDPQGIYQAMIDAALKP